MNLSVLSVLNARLARRRTEAQTPAPHASGAGVLQVENASLWCGADVLFSGLSFNLGAGETLTLMGPSGSGKSSLLHWICGTLAPGLRGTGRVCLTGREIGAEPPETRGLGILFQDDLLFPHLTVAGNLAFGLRSGLRNREARAHAIDAALAEAELAGRGKAWPHELSGGQRVRVALLRTLLSQPSALLLDEPFARLDLALKDRIRGFVFEHARARGLPILLVTHDPADAAAAGGALLHLEAFAPAPAPAPAIAADSVPDLSAPANGP